MIRDTQMPSVQTSGSKESRRMGLRFGEGANLRPLHEPFLNMARSHMKCANPGCVEMQGSHCQFAHVASLDAHTKSLTMHHGYILHTHVICVKSYRGKLCLRE
jgi:hypothetical protein